MAFGHIAIARLEQMRRYEKMVQKLFPAFSFARNFNLVGKCSLSTYLAISAKRPQVVALFQVKKIVTGVEPAVSWRKFSANRQFRQFIFRTSKFPIKNEPPIKVTRFFLIAPIFF